MDFGILLSKSQWIRLDDKSILLTAADIAKIDASLIQWESISRPIHPMFISVCTLMFVSLLGFILKSDDSGEINLRVFKS